MAELKKDPEYLWSKWTSLDLENYYEVVLADILIEILNIQQEKGFSIMPKLLKEWGGYYNTISGGIDTVLRKKYGNVYNFSETKIEKIFKLSKYDTATVNQGIDDAGYKLVMDYIANPNNANKIHEVFQKIDRTKQIYGMVSIATDFRKELKAWGNTICMMNAFHLADEEKCYWMDPTDSDTISWITSIVQELKDLGFDEVVFSEFRIPVTDRISFSGDRTQAIRDAAQSLVTACANENFAVSFMTTDSAFPLPEGRSRVYLENVSAKNVGAVAAQVNVDDPQAKLVFVSNTNDTRFDEYSVMRPISMHSMNQ